MKKGGHKINNLVSMDRLKSQRGILNMAKNNACHAGLRFDGIGRIYRNLYREF